MPSTLMTVVAPCIGTFLSWVLCASSVPGLLRDRRRGKLSTDPSPFPILLVQCAMWILFAGVMSDKFAFAANVPGIVFTGISTTTSLRLCVDERKCVFMEVQLIGGMLVLALATMATVSPIAFEDAEVRKQTIGWLADAYCIAMYLCPCGEALRAVRSRATSKINFPLAVAATANAVFWSIYGFGMGIIFIIIPHTVGVVTGLFQIMVKLGGQRKQEMGRTCSSVNQELFDKLASQEVVTVSMHSLSCSVCVCSDNEPDSELEPGVSAVFGRSDSASLLKLIPVGDGCVAIQTENGNFMQVASIPSSVSQRTLLPTHHQLLSVKSAEPGEAGRFVPIINPMQPNSFLPSKGHHQYDQETVSFWNPFYSVFVRINEVGAVDCSGQVLPKDGQVALPVGWDWERFLLQVTSQ